MIPARDASIPADAEWNAEDGCFSAGPKDPQGQKSGLWKHWYPSGRPYGEDEFAAGESHGRSWCARGEGEETPFGDSIDAKVFRLERTYAHGKLMTDRCLDREGNVVGSDGAPIPERPEGVPAEASYLGAQEIWTVGGIDEPRDGRQLLFARDGRPLSDVSFVDGKRQGAAKYWRHPDTHIELPFQGPELTREIAITYERDAVKNVAFFGASDAETPLVAIDLAGGASGERLDGTLRWNAKWGGNRKERVVAWEGKLVARGDIQGELRKSTRFEATLADGKVTRVHGFDEAGAEIHPPPVIADYGQTITREAIAGYVARGDFARDLAAFFATEERAPLDSAAPRMREKLARLPEAYRAAAIALDEIAVAGKLPDLMTTSFRAYGFDPVENDLANAAEDRYVGLASDSSGSYQLLDLETGKVRSYEHEEAMFDERRSFDDLDTWAFVMARVELVRKKQAPQAAMIALFERLELATGLVEVTSWYHGLSS